MCSRRWVQRLQRIVVLLSQLLLHAQRSNGDFAATLIALKRGRGGLILVNSGDAIRSGRVANDCSADFQDGADTDGTV